MADKEKADRLALVNAMMQGKSKVRPGELTHHSLYQLRGMDETQTPEMQAFLAPYEHGAFVQDMTDASPLVGTGTLLASPLYSIAKGMKFEGVPLPGGGRFADSSKARSPASLKENTEAAKGYLKGLANNIAEGYHPFSYLLPDSMRVGVEKPYKRSPLKKPSE